MGERRLVLVWARVFLSWAQILPNARKFLVVIAEERVCGCLTKAMSARSCNGTARRVPACMLVWGY